MRSEQEAKQAIEKYSDTIRRICIVHMKNYHDAEDVFQDVFLKYILHKSEFKSEEHEKAWLIRVAINVCKDRIRSFFRKNVSSIEDLLIEPFYIEDEKKDVLEAVLNLPPKYKDVVYLYYYEGYSAIEIAALLHKKENTIYTWLSRAREELKSSLGGDGLE